MFLRLLLSNTYMSEIVTINLALWIKLSQLKGSFLDRKFDPFLDYQCPRNLKITNDKLDILNSLSLSYQVRHIRLVLNLFYIAACVNFKMLSLTRCFNVWGALSYMILRKSLCLK
jgi:hypothetical protein